jgi:hypothetical protein
MSSLAATITGASATGSSAGYGVINYNPGSNVDEFLIYGRTSLSDPYIRSSGTLHIAQSINGDGTTRVEGPYTATSYSWIGGTPAASGTHNIENFQPVAQAGWSGADPYTWSSISVAAPAASFKFSFFVHCFYAAADLEIWADGTRLSLYDNVMSSTYLDGGGEARNTDYFYQFTFSGVAVDSTLEFKFTDLQNLGSDWSNIGFLSAGLDYTAPASIENDLTSMPNAVPEPATALILGLGGGLIALYRRFFGRV